MKTFRITETVVYEVEAEDAEEAESLFLQSDDINEFFDYVEKHEVEEA